MTPLFPLIDGRFLSRGSGLLEITDTSSGRGWPRRAERYDSRKGAEAEIPRRIDRRPTLRDAIASAEIDAISDEAYFLAQLRAVVAAFETPADRLLAKYRG
jgi:hypothetical protein